MHKLHVHLTIALLIFSLFSACKHICDCEDDGIEPCAFSYEQVVYTPDGMPGDQLASPMFADEPSSGFFSAEPEGLAIDAETGVIDINASDYGKEYTIKFRIKDSEVFCTARVFINEPEAAPCVISYDDGVVMPGEAEFLTPKFADGYVADGHFTAYPSGLDISPDKGIVNVSASASGVQYYITYISNDKKTICQTTLLITGVDYPERIINFEEGERILNPSFNEQDSGRRSTVGSYEATPSELVFTETQQGETDGSIDVYSTLLFVQSQEFDGQLPEGFSRDYNINYTLSDENKTTSTVELRIYYFSSLGAAQELAPELLEALQDRGQYTGNGRIEKKPRYVLATGAIR